jgi:alpha-amylase
MPHLCLYLQLHQPYRLAPFSVFELGTSSNYFSNKKLDHNRFIFQKVSQKSYLPMLKLLLELSQTYHEFQFALSCSGVFLEQAQKWEPKVIELLQQLAATGQVEFLAETYYHSLASLYSPQEFKKQVKKQLTLIKKLFNQEPTVFRNTELIYSNQIAQQVQELGFSALLTEGVDRYLLGRSKTQVFRAVEPAATTKHSSRKASSPLYLLLKHAELSDDIAFRFSDRNWLWYPLTVDRYLQWLEVNAEDQLVNLFMDFETFGEHQWADPGIFEFFAELVKKTTQRPWDRWVTPSQVVKNVKQQSSADQLPVYDVPQPISWADVDRDLTAWIENPLQQDSLRVLYGLEETLLKQKKRHLIESWRRLQTSDHFYYMCTKWAADGDVHAYFSPYDSPLEAYRRYATVLANLHRQRGESL